MQKICDLSEGAYLCYDKGRFDDWCVFHVSGDGNRRALLDTDYFGWLKTLAKRYGIQRVYDDFVKVYDLTGTRLEDSVLSYIYTLTHDTYPDATPGDRDALDFVFVVLYATMIAEENKKKAILKKRIKRHGVYRILFEDMDLREAANKDKDVRWWVIDAECKALGF